MYHKKQVQKIPTIYDGDIIEKDNYHFKVTFEIDGMCDLDYYGEYTSHPKWNQSNRYMIIDRANRNMGRNEYRYFQCAYDMLDAMQWYKDHGYSKHDCYTLPRQHSKEHYERMESLNRGDWQVLVMTVTCQETLEYDCIGGIESDDKSGIYEYMMDMIDTLLQPLKEVQTRLSVYAI